MIKRAESFRSLFEPIQLNIPLSLVYWFKQGAGRNVRVLI
jgi:hypothetical protein